MAKVLMRLYLLFLATYGSSLYFAPLLITEIFDGRYNQYGLEKLGGPLRITQKYLIGVDGSALSDVVESLNKELAPITLTVLNFDSDELSAQERNDVLGGRISMRLDDDSEPSSAFLPVKNNKVVWIRLPEIPVDFYFIYWSINALVGAALLLGIYFWLRPHWIDLERLKETARRFGKGHLNERAAISRQSDISELGNAFDVMAQQIEDFINRQRDLLNAVSHELRTPLSRLQFGLELMQSDVLTVEARQLLDQQIRHVHELDALVAELLTYGRLQSSEQSVRFERVELCSFIDSVLGDFYEEQERSGKELLVEIKDAPIDFELSPNLTARALQNLVGNAIRYCRKSVQVRVERSGGSLVIAVDDDGEGIPEADRQRVFDPFFRLDRSRDRATGGFGLGLAISRRAVENQGGHLTLQSSSMGGASFIITL